MKKVLVVISVILGSLLILFGSAVLVLRRSDVQTFFAQKATTHLSKYIGADIHIGRIHYQPLNCLVLDSVFIADQQDDTLAYIEHFFLEFHPLELLDKRLNITYAQLDKPYVNLQTINDSILNCQFILDKIQKTDSFPLFSNIA